MSKSKKQDLLEVRPSQAGKLVEACMRARRPVMLWGPPGIGKSDIIRQIGLKQGRPVIDIRLLLKDPTDLSGIPFFNPKSGLMEWAHPKDLPAVASQKDLDAANEVLDMFLERKENASDMSVGEVQDLLVSIETAQIKANNIEAALNLQDAIIFFDEIVSAPPSVMAAGYQLMLDRKVGDYVLPGDVDIVCAGNRQSDRGVVNQMPSPLANRLVHIHMTDSFDDWQTWAISAGVHHDVVGYLSQHKHNLFSFDAKTGDVAFATPRSWKHVSDIITENRALPQDQKLSDYDMRVLISGTIGSALSNEFEQHMKYVGKLPPVEDVLTGKVTSLDVNEISAVYSLAINMCYTLKEWGSQVTDEESEITLENYTNAVDLFFKYTYDNMQAEMCVLAARTLLREFKLQNGVRAAHCKNYKKFVDKYGKMILDD